MSTDPECTDLIARVASGDEAALGELYDRYGRAIFSLARQLTGSERDAEEVVQDVFVGVWAGASRFDAQRAALFTWMVTMARNKAYDVLRKVGRRPPAYSPHTHDGSTLEYVDPASDPGESAFIRERSALVEAWIRSLPEEQSQPILLAFFDGLSHREIAERTGVALGTIKSRIRLGLAALREKQLGGGER